jgi:excisionase family DNA binding protein
MLCIPEAAHYLGVTCGFMEVAIRERTIPSVILGKRRLFDKVDLDGYIDRIKQERG